MNGRGTIRVTLLLTMIILAHLSVGCIKIKSNSPTLQECTLLGCENTLSISMSGDIPNEYTLMVTDSEGNDIIKSCISGEGRSLSNSSGGVICESWGVSIRNYSPDDLIITIDWANGSMSESFRPTYEQFRPNGPGCPPVCRVGMVSITFPASK